MKLSLITAAFVAALAGACGYFQASDVADLKTAYDYRSDRHACVVDAADFDAGKACFEKVEQKYCSHDGGLLVGRPDFDEVCPDGGV